mgnify:CR=1 FL=1
MINLSVAITVFPELHGHGPLDPFTTPLLNVVLIVLFLSGFHESLICFEQCCFEFLGLRFKGQRFNDLTLLAISVRDNDFDS